MNFAADMGRHSGQATPSLHDDPYRQFNEATGRRSTYPLPIPVQTIRTTSDEHSRHRPGHGFGAGGNSGDPSSFSGPREFAAFLGLMPRQHSSGDKVRLGRITKMGNNYLRKLLVVGAHAVLHHQARHDDPLRNWARKLLATKPFKLVAVACAHGIRADEPKHTLRRCLTQSRAARNLG